MTRRRFSETKLAKRLLEFDGKCAECGGKVGGAHGLEWDHVIPLALGGADELENLAPMCRGCHRAKTKGDVQAIRKSQRMQRRQQGIRRTVKRPIGDPRFRKKLNGDVVPKGGK